MYITDLNKTKLVKTPSGNSIWWLIPKEIGAPNFELRYFEVKANGRTSPGKHSWEHEVFVVKGQGIIRGEEFEEELGSGHAVFISPNEEHQFINPNKEPFGFICVIPKGYEQETKKLN